MKKNIDLIVNGVKPEKVMYDTDNHSLVVLYPAQEEFKKGDVLAFDDILLIFDEYANKERSKLHSLWNNFVKDNRYWKTKAFIHATDEQKAQVHQLLKKDGKKWNAETLEVEDLDISEIVIDLESACKYLKKPMPNFSSLFYSLPVEDYNKYYTQITLQLIREAWNKADGFVVDWENSGQSKYYPIINLFTGNIEAGVGCVSATVHSACYSFKSKKRAIQFGTQFKELFKVAMGL